MQETAKKHGLTGYSKKSKKELADFIVDRVPLLDTPVPANEGLLTPLTPSKYKHKFVPQSLKSILSKVRVKINSFADWLLSYIPPETKKVVNEKMESLKNRVSEIYRELSGKKFEIRETKSAMGGKCKQYTIDGREGIDELSFLNAVQPLVIALLKQKIPTRFYMVLTCDMGGPVPAFFTSRYRNCNQPPDAVLATTNVEEVYRNAVDRILENRDRCQMCGSGYSFRSVVKLDIHTQVYKPLRGGSYIPLP